MNAADWPRRVARPGPVAPPLHRPAFSAAQAPLSQGPEVNPRDHADPGFSLRPCLDSPLPAAAPRLEIWIPGFYFQFFLRRASSAGPLEMTL